MKVGILTFTNGTNIGQRLQNYALQATLLDMGFDVFTIRQSNPFSRWKLLKSGVKRMLIALKSPHEYINSLKRVKAFSEFNRININFYNNKLSFNKDNTWIKKEFDAFIVGSDQVWNPCSPYVGDNFFLTFADPKQRFTYAPSFSIDEIGKHDIKLFSDRLNGFSDISVREYRGAQIIKKLTNKDSIVVLDPTLLLGKDKWDKIKVSCPLRSKKPYILSFFLGIIEKEEIVKIGTNEGCDVIYVDNTTNIDPGRFLDLIQHAKIVLTDSYHVTIFSILYHRPFVNFRRQGTKNSMNSRFQTLYGELGIRHREWDYLKNHEKEIYNIDFESIQQKIEEKRMISRDYLDNTIGLLLKHNENIN